MPKNVLVVGMPRSGTSMVTGIFARAGYFVTDEPDSDLRPGDQNNPDGYWEAESLVEKNAELFRASGYPAHNSWLFEPIRPEMVQRLKHLRPRPQDRTFLSTYEANSPWVWKDPRLCYTLGYWWGILDPDSTRVILTVRDPEAIYRSFLRLGWRSDSPDSHRDVMARIESHLQAARNAIHSHAIPCLEVEYEVFATDPSHMASSLAEFCALELGPEDLGFEKRFDHSGLRGRLATGIDRAVTALPPGMRGALKKLTPASVVAALFPERTD